MMFRIVTFVCMVAVALAFNTTMFRLEDSVIPPYQRAVTLLQSGIINKLLTSNIDDLHHMSSELPHELYCTVEAVQSKLKEAMRANRVLRAHVSARIDQLLDSILHTERRRVQIERQIIDLNNSVEQARENVRREDESMATARRTYFHDTQMSFRRFQDWQNRRSDNAALGQHDGPGEFHSDDNRRLRITRCFPSFEGSPRDRGQTEAIRVASTRLENEERRLQDAVVEENTTQSHLVQLNTTLQQQQAVRATVRVLTRHFAPINNQLKAMSHVSKRLIDLAMDVLDDKTVGKPLRLIYEKLLNEKMIEPYGSKLSERIMEQSKQRLKSIATKLPQMQYRRQDFRQPCAF